MAIACVFVTLVLAKRGFNPGTLVVAGIIATEEAETLAAFEAQGLHVRSREQEGDWVALVLTR